jgi:cell division protein FtsQ
MSVFDIRTVSVEGASAVPDLLIRNQVDSMLRGQTTFTVDTDAVVKKVEQQPFVRSAEVNRHLPDGLSIRVTEYEPLAFGVARDGGWLIARDGRVLNRARLDDWRARVPVIRLQEDKVTAGERLSAEPAILVLRSVPPSFPGSIRAVDRTKESGYVASLHDGPSIRLGRAQDLDRKLSVAGRMLAMFSRTQQDELEYVDVTVPARPAVKQG